MVIFAIRTLTLAACYYARCYFAHLYPISGLSKIYTQPSRFLFTSDVRHDRIRRYQITRIWDWLDARYKLSEGKKLSVQTSFSSAEKHYANERIISARYFARSRIVAGEKKTSINVDLSNEVNYTVVFCSSRVMESFPKNCDARNGFSFAAGQKSYRGRSPLLLYRCPINWPYDH